MSNSSIYSLKREPQPDYPEHCHDFSEIALVYAGSGIHVKNDTQKVLLPNSIHAINYNDYHLYSHTNDVCLINLCYRPMDLNVSRAAVDIIKKLDDKTNNLLVTKEAFQHILATANLIEQEQGCVSEHRDHMIDLLFERLLIQIDRLNVSHLAENHVMQAIVHLCDHYKDQDLSVAKVCEQYQVTQSKLNRELTALTGMSANRFLNTLRINKAKHLLAQGWGVTDTAFFLGYNDSNYFSVKFKSLTGMCPREYVSQGHCAASEKIN